MGRLGRYGPVWVCMSMGYGPGPYVWAYVRYGHGRYGYGYAYMAGSNPDQDWVLLVVGWIAPPATPSRS